jgi:hypothetical protein
MKEGVIRSMRKYFLLIPIVLSIILAACGLSKDMEPTSTKYKNIETNNSLVQWTNIPSIINTRKKTLIPSITPTSTLYYLNITVWKDVPIIHTARNIFEENHNSDGFNYLQYEITMNNSLVRNYYIIELPKIFFNYSGEQCDPNCIVPPSYGNEIKWTNELVFVRRRDNNCTTVEIFIGKNKDNTIVRIYQGLCYIDPV